jgi:superfamily I DNA/RNA helicase
MSGTLTAYESAVAELRRNPDQWKAFESRGNCVTLAGPGSGKTKVLTSKMARMLREDVRSPRGVACVTYNNECARELERRLDHLGVADHSNIFIGTVHSFCLRFVVRSLAALVGIEVPHPVVVASEAVQRQLFDEAMSAVGVRAEGFRTDFDRFRRTALDRTEGVDGWEAGDGGLTDVCIEYERLLRSRGRIDFDDIVLLAVRAIEASEVVRRCLRAQFPVLLVDEYQDLGVPLHRLVLRLCLGAGVRLFAVGDPDQSIYGFT